MSGPVQPDSTDESHRERLDLGPFHEMLRPEETILMALRANFWRAIWPLLLGAAFFGYGAYEFFSSYYVHDTIEAACGASPKPGCAKYYNIAWWFAPTSLVLAAISAIGAIGHVFGAYRPIYVITDQRLLVRVRLFRSKIDAVELKGAWISRDWTGLIVRNAWRRVDLGLAPPIADRAYRCLTDLVHKRSG